MDSARAHIAATAFEGLLLEQFLQPLAHGNDAMALFGTGALARAIAEHDAGGFASLITASLERLHGNDRT